MSKKVGFYHGALSDSYEKQANDQGYTLGDKQELMQKLGLCLNVARINGLLTDSQYDSALQKLQKKIAAALKPREEAPHEH